MKPQTWTYTDLALKHEPQTVDSRRMGHEDPELRLGPGHGLRGSCKGRDTDEAGRGSEF